MQYQEQQPRSANQYGSIVGENRQQSVPNSSYPDQSRASYYGISPRACRQERLLLFLVRIRKFNANKTPERIFYEQRKQAPETPSKRTSKQAQKQPPKSTLKTPSERSPEKGTQNTGPEKN